MAEGRERLPLFVGVLQDAIIKATQPGTRFYFEMANSELQRQLMQLRSLLQAQNQSVQQVKSQDPGMQQVQFPNNQNQQRQMHMQQNLQRHNEQMQRRR